MFKILCCYHKTEVGLFTQECVGNIKKPNQVNFTVFLVVEINGRFIGLMFVTVSMASIVVLGINNVKS
jgi:hypothetical protein